jgi:hypothetical protein
METLMHSPMKATMLVALLYGAILGAIGCVQKGPAQRAGAALDRAAEDVQDTINPPGPAQRAGRVMDRALDNVTQ